MTDDGGGKIETLEARRLFASVSFASGVWTLTADNTAETIRVYRVVETDPASDRIKFQIGTTIWSRDSSDITSKVQVIANDGDDTVLVETDLEITNNLTALSTTPKGNDGVHKVVEVQGGNGNDTVYAGDLGDIVFGNAGTDNLDTRNGADLAYGGGNNDTINGGEGGDVQWGDDYDGEESGADVINGGAGADHAYGGSGNDTLHGDEDNDWVWGDHPTVTTNTGDDHLWGDGGDDYFKGGPGNDEFWAGGNGTDNIDGGTGTDTLRTWDAGTDTYSNIESFG